MNNLLRAMLLVMIFFLSGNAVSEVLILSPDRKNALIIASRLRAEIPDSRIIHRWTQSSEADAVVTLGATILAENIQKIDVPVIASLVTPFDLYSVKKEISAVYHIAPPEALLRFLSEHIGDLRLGYLYTNPKDAYLAELIEISDRYGIKIVAKENTDLFKTLRKFNTRVADVILITNDTAVFSSNKVRFALESLYRQRLPSIGMSRQLIGVGVAATLYPSIDASIKKTATTVKQFLKTGETVRTYPDTVISEFDEKLARIFNLSIDQKPGWHYEK